MKQLIFTVTTDLNYDQRMQRICSSLQNAGYNVLLVGRKLPSSAPLKPQPFSQHRLACKFHKGKLFYLEFMVRLCWYLQKSSAEAYCAIDLDTALPVYFTAKAKKKHFVFDAHEYFPEVIELQNRPTAKKVWQWVEKFIITRTKFAYTVTQTIAKQFFTLYGTQFEVIRNTTVLQPTVKRENKPDRYFIYQGALNEGRGLEQTIRAMQEVDAKLVICGSGDVAEDLKKLCLELQVQNKVEFAGYVFPDKLKELTQGAWAGLNLLENRGLSYYFSLANKFFDYVHAEIPQICADFPEYRALNRQYEVALLTEAEPNAIAAAMKTLLHNNERYQQLSANCAIARQVWNWQNEEKKLLAFYNMVVPL